MGQGIGQSTIQTTCIIAGECSANTKVELWQKIFFFFTGGYGEYVCGVCVCA